MKCPRCGRDSEKGWEYCPRCGLNLRGRGPGFFRFDDIFERVHRQMEETNRMFEKDFEVFDLSPMFRDIEKRPVSRNARGFRITMSSGTGREPKIDVQTFGDNRNELRKEILEQLGTGKGTGTEGKEKRRFRIPQLIGPRGETREPAKAREPFREAGGRRELPTPSRTEEPRTEIKRMDSKVVVNIEIPGVKSEENIDVRELESSVEVKALAGDRAYFKILTKPSRFRLSEKRFERGRLHLEFS